MIQPEPIQPEDRDWTFVITDGCDECGFRPQAPETTGSRLRATIPVWTEVLGAEGRSANGAPLDGLPPAANRPGLQRLGAKGQPMAAVDRVALLVGNKGRGLGRNVWGPALSEPWFMM